MFHINDEQKTEQYNISYNYDNSGNMRTRNLTSPSLQIPKNMQIDTKSNRLLNNGQYDKCGNSSTLNDKGLNWDFMNNLKSCINKDFKEYYVYSSRQRIRKVKCDLKGNIVEEKLYVGNYELENSKNIKLKISDFLILHNEKSTNNWIYRYLLTNNINSVNLELNEMGEMISYEEYYPYGGSSVHHKGDGFDKKEFGWVGQEKDEFSSLIYFGARYYCSFLCRWINPDPGGTVDGLNLFIYVNSNPITFFDIGGYGKGLDLLNKARDETEEYKGINLLNKAEKTQFSVLPKLTFMEKVRHIEFKTTFFLKSILKELVLEEYQSYLNDFTLCLGTEDNKINILYDLCNFTAKIFQIFMNEFLIEQNDTKLECQILQFKINDKSFTINKHAIIINNYILEEGGEEAIITDITALQLLNKHTEKIFDSTSIGQKMKRNLTWSFPITNYSPEYNEWLKILSVDNKDKATELVKSREIIIFDATIEALKWHIQNLWVNEHMGLSFEILGGLSEHGKKIKNSVLIEDCH